LSIQGLNCFFFLGVFFLGTFLSKLFFPLTVSILPLQRNSCCSPFLLYALPPLRNYMLSCCILAHKSQTLRHPGFRILSVGRRVEWSGTQLLI